MDFCDLSKVVDQTPES